MTDLRARAVDLDAADPLAAYRDRFVIAEPDLIYLDGNSLGRLPVSTREKLREVVDREWGVDLVRGWSGWISMGPRVGEVIAEIVGAGPGQVTLSDTTSINLYKLAAAALDDRPDRNVIITDDDNFPTDQYVLQGLAAARGGELRTVAVDIDNGVTVEDVRAALDDRVALVSLSHVAYRSGAVADVAAITAAAHEYGALMLWDVCHSAGAVEVDLDRHGVDLAVGCTYKHLNGGPGGPAFLYVRRDLQSRLRQPIWGWFGQRDQFAMANRYEPADGLERFLVSSPQIIGGYAAWEGARITAEAGIGPVAAKGTALGDYLIELADAWLDPYGFRLASPRAPGRRGAHVTLYHPQAWQISQALRAADVIPDFRTPDRLRLGLAPLYTRFVDVHDAMVRLREIMEKGSWREFPTEHARVT